MKDKDDVSEFIGCCLMVLVFGIFFSLPISIATYMVIDSADVKFVEKCVKAGATYENCYKIVNPTPKEYKEVTK